MQSIENLQEADETEDLEAKERRLMELNEKLENHQKKIVSKAQELIQENVEFLRNPKLGNLNEDTMSDPKQVGGSHDEFEDGWVSDVEVKEPERCTKEKLRGVSLVGKFETAVAHYRRSLTEEEKADLADLQLEEDIVGASQMSESSQLKLQKARYKALEKNFQELSGALQHKDRELIELTKQRDIIFKENKKLSRQLSNATGKVSKAERIAEECENKVALLRNQVTEEKRKFKEIQRVHKEHNQKTRTKDIRLTRALEEAEKAKKELLAFRSDNRDNTTNRIQKITGLQKENKQLRSEKKKLVTAFKKQMKLVDILKRQKLHMEAMKLLSYSEDAFLKLVSQGE